MLNYIKSEFYRILHGRAVYILTAVLSLLLLLMNGALSIFARTPGFAYGEVRYSLNLLTGSLSVLFVGAWLVAGYLFGDEYKNGTLKNTIASGISRGVIFAGKCIVCGVTAVIIMVIVLTVYAGSAYLFLGGNDMKPLLELLKGAGAAMPSALAALVLAVFLLCVIKKEGMVMLLWIVVIWVIPPLFYYLGYQVELFAVLAKWMPSNIFRFETAVNMSGYECLWNTAEGLARCLIAGVGSTVLFYIVGFLIFRKKEID